MAVAHVFCVFLLLIIHGEHSLAVDVDVSKQGDNILDVCENSGALTFVKYARATPWVKAALENGTSYMVLAPSDRAFDALPPVIKAALKDPQTLGWYLRYHIALTVAYVDEIDNNLRIPSAFRPPGPQEDLPEPVLNIRFNVYDIKAEGNSGKFGKKVTASGAPIIIADKEASNGVVHILDKVMFPIPTGANVPQFVQDDSRFSTLLAFLKKANLTGALQTDPSKPLTVFAPNNDAFSNLPKDVVKQLSNVTLLQHVLEYHVVSGAYYAAGLYDNQSLLTLFGKSLLVQQGPGGTFVEDSKVLQADNTVTNGVVHEISAVMLPPK